MEETWRPGEAVVWRIPGAGGRGFLPDVPGVVVAVGRRAVTVQLAMPTGLALLCDVRPEALFRPGAMTDRKEAELGPKGVDDNGTPEAA